jgi:hypothetical protein
MLRKIKGFADLGPGARAGWYLAGAALLAGAAWCGVTIEPAPRGQVVTAAQVVRLAGVIVGLLGATALFATASMPRPVYVRRPHGPVRRSLRWCRNGLAVVSMIACLAATTLWARSYRGSDYVSRNRLLDATPLAITGRIHRVSWTRGDIRLAVIDHTAYPNGASVAQAPTVGAVHWGWGRLGAARLGWGDAPTLQRASLWARLGFACYETGSAASFYDERERGIAVPAWLPVVTLALLPLAAVARLVVTRARRRAGRCLECGYDLRGCVGRCSECGLEFPAVV